MEKDTALNTEKDYQAKLPENVEVDKRNKSTDKTEPNEEKKKRYKHPDLNYSDRITISVLKNRNVPVREIAAEIGCHRSAIYKELKRATYVHTNSDLTEEVRYNPEQAQVIHEFAQSAKGPRLKIDNDHEFAAYIEKKIIEEKRSPQGALDDVVNEQKNFKVKIKSARTIYSYIDKGIFDSLKRKHLPCGKEKRKYKKIRRVHRKPKTDTIEQRPEEVGERCTFGHWEMDTVKGPQGGDKNCLLVLTERFTRYQINEPMKACTTEEVRKALNRIEKEYGSKFYKIFKTVTVDNGSEFQDWESIEKALYRVGKRWKLYYCHPYSSYERGTNENNNKLIRRWVPKGVSFVGFTRKQAKEIADWMNNYPRPIFGGKTSKMLYDIEIQKLFGAKDAA